MTVKEGVSLTPSDHTYSRNTSDFADYVVKKVEQVLSTKAEELMKRVEMNREPFDGRSYTETYNSALDRALQVIKEVIDPNA